MEYTQKERRCGNRKKMDIPVTKQVDEKESNCWISDLSPTGIKLHKYGMATSEHASCNIELHLVPGAITTVIAAERVWQDDDYEAFQFVSPTFAQQMIIERMVGNL